MDYSFLETILAKGPAVLIAGTVKGTLVIGIAWLAVSVLRVSAAVRHMIWFLSLLSLLVIPLLALCIPQWSVDILPYYFAGFGIPQTAGGSIGSQAQWLPVIGILWIVGFLVVLSPTVAGLFFIRRMAAAADAGQADFIVKMVDQVRNKLGLKKNIRLVISSQSRCKVPISWGVIQPTLMLPGIVKQWPRSQIKMVLLHELSHISRYDWLVMMIARGICAVYWFNPLVWLALRKLNIECECASDDTVLRCGIQGPHYAQALVSATRRLKTFFSVSFCTNAWIKRFEIKKRIFSILDGAKPHTALKRTATIKLTAILIAVLLPFSSLHLTIAKIQRLSPVFYQLPNTPLVDASLNQK